MVADLSERDWDSTPNINLRSVFPGSKNTLHIMLCQSVVKTSSAMGLSGKDNYAAYKEYRVAATQETK